MVETFENNQLTNYHNKISASIYDVPTQVFQTKILCYYGSKELFILRGVCGDWSDSIKLIWCHIVKEEMLEQVHSLDLLYEKETTAKLLEFKIRYLVSYATLMRNYFMHMNFEEIVQDLFHREDQRGKQILLIACMIVAPQSLNYPAVVEDINDTHIRDAAAYMLTEEFKQQFAVMCQMDSIPDVSLGQMKLIKGEFIEKIIQPEVIDQLGNAARLLNSWIDGALEYTILKHEVIVLRLKNNKVLEKIKQISSLWPKKKSFIEGAYKLLLFTKTQRSQINCAMTLMKQRGLYELMDFKEAVNKVLKKWYEQRIQEETDRNKKLRDLHDNLTKIKIMREEESMRQQQMEIDRKAKEEKDRNMGDNNGSASKRNQENSNSKRETQANSDVNETQQDPRFNTDDVGGAHSDDDELLAKEILERKRKLEEEMEVLKQEIKQTNNKIEQTQAIVDEKLQQQEEEQKTCQCAHQRLHDQKQDEEEEKSSFQTETTTTQVTDLNNQQDDEEQINTSTTNAQSSIPQQQDQDQPQQESDIIVAAGQQQNSEILSNLQSQTNANLFSSQLLSQILSVGTLFTQKALLDGDKAEMDDEDNEDDINMNKYGYDDLDNYMTPEELRREIYENILKKRIFQADRVEKLEKVLVNMELIPKDQIYCSSEMLSQFKEAVLADDEKLLKAIYEAVMNEKEEFWFDIYRSISAQSGEQQELERKKLVRIERRKKRMLKQKDELRQQRIQDIAQGVYDRQNHRRRHANDRLRERRFSDGQLIQVHRGMQGRRNSQTRDNNQQVNGHGGQQPANNQGEGNPLNNVVVGLAAIRYLLDTAIEAVQRRQVIQNNLVAAQNQLQIQLDAQVNANNNLNEIAIQTDDNFNQQYQQDEDNNNNDQNNQNNHQDHEEDQHDQE